ncbi:MAG: ATP-dependent Clp protease proteolytic subunit [Verrucomicrobiia bacterium]
MKFHSRFFLVSSAVAALLLSGGVASQALGQATDSTNNAKTAATAKPAEPSTAFPELRKQQEQLTLENSIAEQQLRKELARLTAEKQKLELENSLNQQKLQAEIASMQAEIEKLTKQADLLAKRAAIKDAERKARVDAELADAREKLEKARLTNDLAAAELATKTRDLAQRDQELKLRLSELQVQHSEFDLQLAKLNDDIDLRAKRDLWKNRVNRDIQYTKEPFKDGMLTISDRRIPLNGPIWGHTADYVAERIDYFNNQSKEYPIFIVIDESPGGSVMAGYKILKAMEGSAAPVYVVVKSFAASMAANIVTQSKKSFAYPNAIVLHHQILTGSFGNLTEQKENLKILEEWWKRLAAPVAAKMGISLDEFIKRMYQNRSTGDWMEFGDSARKLKWVDEIAETVREESYDKNPDAPSTLPGLPPPVHGDNQLALQERVDANGRRYVLLPRLDPVDCYYLYNPDNYYRLTP